MTFAHYGFAPQHLEKRSRLLSDGVNPYPYAYPGAQKIAAVIAAADQDVQEPARVAGRIWARRRMGKVHFVDLQDDSGKIQLYLARSSFTDQQWEHLSLLDLGDILGVDGDLFRTRTGELSISVSAFAVLAKSVVPVPIGKEDGERTYYRVTDPESRYRERYLHWLLDDQARERIRRRARIISCIHRRMEEEDFLEVSTPTISSVYGGAEARPFSTSVWALDHQEVFLRISPELHLKRYIVAGFDRVFTICQNFRNEGIDHSHNPEFTMIEWYEAFTDYQDQMRRFEELVADVCREVCGSTHITYQGVELDFTPPWQRLTVLEALEQSAGVAASPMSAAELRDELIERDIEIPADLTWGRAVAALFEATCEERLIQPTFILDHPREICPLTKVKRGDERLSERFEPYVYGIELGNAYSELTDPVDQLERFLAQRHARSNEANCPDHPLDADFVRALGCGMPPTGGVGLGVDRLVMFLTDAPGIRDIIPFPMVKPRRDGASEEEV